MKVLLMSDSHGYLYNARQVIKNNADIKTVVHLGDYVRDAVKLSQLYPDISFEYVYGNCDFVSDVTYYDKTIEISGKRIFITHGHRYSVKQNYTRIIEKAKIEQADAVCYGHTHVAVIDSINNILIVNPGSISESRSSRSESYAILEISDDEINASIYYL